MLRLYQVGIAIVSWLLPVISLFNNKLRRGIQGRRGLWEQLEKHYYTSAKGGKKIILHVSSFGELEQANPIIKRLKSEHPDYHIHLTFFSPSGYENTNHKYSLPDLITYLPFDTKRNASRFLEITKPDLFIFVRYDVWHTLVDELHSRKIPILLISATFSEKKNANPLVKALYKTTYSKLDSILSIRESDRQALLTLGIDTKKILVTGDTRFDQVLERRLGTEAQEKNLLPFTAVDKSLLVAGSTWEADELLLHAVMEDKELAKDMVLVIVPHEVNPGHIASLQKLFAGNTQLYSDLEKGNSYIDGRVIVVDSIWKLFSLYRNTQLAYVGGGFGAGVHNVLEAAVWRSAVLFGPKIDRSLEIGELVAAGGGFVIHDATELHSTVERLLYSLFPRVKACAIAEEFVQQNGGATEAVLKVIVTYL